MCQEPKTFDLMSTLLFFVAARTETATPKMGSLYNSSRIRSLSDDRTCAAASSFRLAVSSAYSGRAGEWPQSPSEERTSESAAEPRATHRERLTIQSATARDAFSPQGERLARGMSNQPPPRQRQCP